MANSVRDAVYRALFLNKTKHSVDYLGIEIPEYRDYLENLFEEGMSWDNYGEWEIDHIIPIWYEKEWESETYLVYDDVEEINSDDDGSETYLVYDDVEEINEDLNNGIPTLEQIIERLHYTNTQPLWARDNASKGNRRIGK